MSVLCDTDIKTICMGGAVEPFYTGNVQPASYELTLDGHLLYVARKDLDNVSYDVRDRVFVDHRMDNYPITYRPWDMLSPDEHGVYNIMPGEFYIASSIEYLKIPADIMSRFEGKSTLGRVGLMVHITAGYVDPGFEGNLTLEMANVAPWPIKLRHGDKIGQLSFHRMSDIPEVPYGEAGNHYQGQMGATLPL